MRFLFKAVLIWGLWAASALAEVPILSAPEAQTRLADNSLVLLDIRTPREWRQTGVAEGAWPVSMHRRDFGERLQAILDVYPPDQIALICAVGGRTAQVTAFLDENGIDGVADLSEGMKGNQRGPGWVARGLPVVPLEEAMATYEAAQASWALTPPE